MFLTKRTARSASVTAAGYNNGELCARCGDALIVNKSDSGAATVYLYLFTVLA
jgi:hypothetical protein